METHDTKSQCISKALNSTSEPSHISTRDAIRVVMFSSKIALNAFETDLIREALTEFPAAISS